MPEVYRVMVTIQSRGGPPDLEDVKRTFGLEEGDLDRDFGVVEVDDTDGTYTVLVVRRAAGKLRDTADWTVEGPYANPRIETFGPPER